MQIILDIPDEIARNLESRKEDLPQILALGLREIMANPSTGFSGLTEILEFLAKLPSPEEILALRLSPMVQAEIESLLDKNRTQGLDESDGSTYFDFAQYKPLTNHRCLWQHYEFIEHLVASGYPFNFINLYPSYFKSINHWQFLNPLTALRASTSEALRSVSEVELNSRN
jgi:hypothetical protein